MSRRWLKALAVWPHVAISWLLWLVFGAALPLRPGAIVFWGSAAIAVALAVGQLEKVASRLLHGARAPTQEQLRRLAVPLGLVEDRTPLTGIRVTVGQTGLPACGVGRRTVVLDPSLVDAYRAGQLSHHEVAALIAYAVGRQRYGLPRFDLLVAFWRAPWDFIRSLFVGAGKALSWVPLGKPVWRARFITGAIAVVLEVQAGRPASAVICAVFVALTYLMPTWQRRWERHLSDAADQFVADLGLAPALVRYLRRFRSDTGLLDRMDRLTAPVHPPWRQRPQSVRLLPFEPASFAGGPLGQAPAEDSSPVKGPRSLPLGE